MFLHGCSGMFDRSTGLISRLERDWASVLNGDGYSVLMVDSFRPRSIDQTCAPTTYNPAVVAARPKDAYGALYYLQNQSFVRGDRIALIGWSAGGGTVLRTIPQQSGGRPASLPQGDFRVAVAFYPALCSDQREAASWTSNIPLLVLFGAADVWTPLAPCQNFIAGALARGSRIELHTYPGAYHAFDAPDRPLRRLPQYTTTAGVVPIVGTDPAARRVRSPWCRPFCAAISAIERLAAATFAEDCQKISARGLPDAHRARARSAWLMATDVVDPFISTESGVPAPLPTPASPTTPQRCGEPRQGSRSSAGRWRAGSRRSSPGTRPAEAASAPAAAPAAARGSARRQSAAR